MAQGDGGKRYCPNCKKIVETRVLPDRYSQKEYDGISAKRRQVICGIDKHGTNGCGTKWYTLEVEENALNLL
jgi:hypothetical protein